MARSQPAETALVEALVRLLGGSVRHGETLSGELRAGADPEGPLCALVTIKIQRVTTAIERITWAEAALAELREKPYLVLRCACETRGSRRKSGYTRGPRCSARVTHAVQYRSRSDGTPRFIYTCGTHAKRPDLDPSCIVGSVALRARDLEEIHALEQLQADQRRQQREEGHHEAHDDP